MNNPTAAQLSLTSVSSISCNQAAASTGDMLYTFTADGITIVQELDDVVLDMNTEA